MAKDITEKKLDDSSLHKLWQTALVAELKPFLYNNQVYASFEILLDTPQIFSLNPADDYEVDERTISGWQLVYNSEDVLSGEYFSALKKLRPFILDQQNDSILLQVSDPDSLIEVLKA